jgi:hypothetical protein
VRRKKKAPTIHHALLAGNNGDVSGNSKTKMS